MNVVVIDGANFAGDADFPMLNLKKYGWEQYPHIPEGEEEKYIWRCDVIVAAKDPINKAMLDTAFKLRLIVAAGDSTDHIDLEVAKERGITVCHVPGKDAANPADDRKLCREVVSAINAFIKGDDYNRVV